MDFRAKAAIKMAKATSKTIKKMNRGSGVTLPGYVARKMDSNILAKLSKEIKEKIIVTMGTNGKTTTNSILAKALEREGKKVIINRTGANMMNGIISSFVLNADDEGNIDADYACIEVDELASVGVLEQLKPDILLLTNISRDQLDRFGEVDITYQKIKEAIEKVPETKLIINADDILSYSLALECKNPYATFGISEQIFDDTSKSEIRESIFCRKCGEKLNYEFFHYGQLGIYSCPNKDFERPIPDYEGNNISFEEELYKFSIDGLQINSTSRTPYNIYNTISAYAALKEIGAPINHIKETFENFDYGNNREDIFWINGARVQLHLAKNPIGFQQKVSHILKDKRPKDVIIQINDTYQDGEDISWLWDVDFQYLGNANTNAIICTGSRRYDMGLRLRYEDVPCAFTTNLKETVNDITKRGTKNLYIIVNYSGLYSTNHMLHLLEDEKDENITWKQRMEKETLKWKNMLETYEKEESEGYPCYEGMEKYISIIPKEKEKIGKKITIGHLYPDLLNLYGDRGNIACFKKRLLWRGIDVEVIPYVVDSEIDFDKLDIILLGGGSDREQKLVCNYLMKDKEKFMKYVENKGCVLAVCGGYQLLGKTYKTENETIEGLGILDIETKWEKERLIRNIILKSSRYNHPIVGFENHGGRTYIYQHKPFGEVFYGLGNTGKGDFEGVVYKNIIATYLHGPLLPKNPEVCDDLLRRALKYRYGEQIELCEIDDRLEHHAGQAIVKRYEDRKYKIKEAIKRRT